MHHSASPPSTSSICALLELLEARVGEVERDGDAADAVGREPLVREPVVRAEGDVTRVELAVQIARSGPPARWPRS